MLGIPRGVSMVGMVLNQRIEGRIKPNRAFNNFRNFYISNATSFKISNNNNFNAFKQDFLAY